MAVGAVFENSSDAGVQQWKPPLGNLRTRRAPTFMAAPVIPSASSSEA